MESEKISREVQAFLYERISTYDQLEVLLRLRSHGGVSTAAAISASVSIDRSCAVGALDELVASGLVESEGSGKDRAFKYRPGDEARESIMTGLARAYDENRLDIVKLMTRNAIERVRNQAVNTFADAFVLGKGKKDG